MRYRRRYKYFPVRIRPNIYSRLGQAPDVNPAVAYALAHSVPLLSAITRNAPVAGLGQTTDSIDKNKVAASVGKLAVSLDGTQIIRIGLTFSNTPYFTFRSGTDDTWMTGLGFVGPNRGKVIFVPASEFRNWKIVLGENDTVKLYGLAGIPNKFESDVTVETFVQSFEQAFTRADEAITVALGGDWLGATEKLNETGKGTRALMDWAKIQLKILMSMGVFQDPEVSIFTNQVWNPIKLTTNAIEAAVVAKNAGQLKTLATQLENDTKVAGDAIDAFAEEALLRFMKLYFLSREFVAGQSAIVSRLEPQQAKMVAAEKAALAGAVQAIGLANAQRLSIKEKLAAIGIDAEVVLAEAMQEAGVSGAGLDGVFSLLGKAAIKVFRNPRVVGRALARAIPVVGRTTLGTIIKHTVGTAWVGVVFGFAGVFFEHGWKSWWQGERGQIEAWKESLKLQAQAQKEFQEEVASRNKDFSAGASNALTIGKEAAKLHPDPALTSTIDNIIKGTQELSKEAKTVGLEKNGLGTALAVLASAVLIGAGAYLLIQQQRK